MAIPISSVRIKICTHMRFLWVIWGQTWLGLRQYGWFRWKISNFRSVGSCSRFQQNFEVSRNVKNLEIFFKTWKFWDFFEIKFRKSDGLDIFLIKSALIAPFLIILESILGHSHDQISLNCPIILDYLMTLTPRGTVICNTEKRQYELCQGTTDTKTGPRRPTKILKWPCD